MKNLKEVVKKIKRAGYVEVAKYNHGTDVYLCRFLPNSQRAYQTEDVKPIQILSFGSIEEAAEHFNAM